METVKIPSNVAKALKLKAGETKYSTFDRDKFVDILMNKILDTESIYKLVDKECLTLNEPKESADWDEEYGSINYDILNELKKLLKRGFKGIYKKEWNGSNEH